jgi:tetratricopeptide (TPR) repeat protein
MSRPAAAAFLIFALATAVSPAAAQLPQRSPRAAAAMPSSYRAPLCQLSGSGADDGISRLKSALAADRPDARASELEKGRASLNDAIVHGGADGSSAAWHALAEIYLYQGDLVGADSALRRAQAISPGCAPAIDSLRTNVWTALASAGGDLAQGGANDSALALFKQAVIIHPEKSVSLLSAGILLAKVGQTDSSIVYFQRAAAAAEREDLPDMRKQATRDLAAMLERAGRHQEAVAALEHYLAWQPDDHEVQRALALAYRAAGRTEEARALEAKLGAAPTATPDDALRAAVSLYQEQKFAEAAAAFERAHAASPYNREALRGLAASYQELNDGPKLVDAAGKLVDVEPLNVDALRLLAVGYQLTNQPDRAMETARQLVGCVTAVSIDQFRITADSAVLTSTATGQAAESSTGKPTPPAATALVFEFLDAAGTVVSSKDVVIPALKPNETTPVSVRVPGKGIVAWRYRRKPSP